jgi:hypothetical protein
MKVEFITETQQIGDVWNTSLETTPVSVTKHDPHTGEKIQEIHLSKDNELAVLTYEGLKFADTLFRTKGLTLKVDFETTSIEGLAEHKLMLADKTWATLDSLHPGDLCLDKNLNPIQVIKLSPGGYKDVYDIQVPDGHHYIANDLVSHNSSLAAQLAINWANMGESVTMVSLEMSAEEMTARLMANAAEIDVRKILFRKMSKDEKVKYWDSYKKFIKEKKKVGGSFNIFKPRQDMSIEDITASTFPLNSRILIIDYISLLKGVDGDDAWQKLGAVARYCKVYAESKNIIVVLLCQVSDDGKIRYAQAIKEHANYAWIFVSTKTTRENEILNIEQLKARNGRMFDFSLRARLDVMRITDLEPGEDSIASKNSTSFDKTNKKSKYKGNDNGIKNQDNTNTDSKPRDKYISDLADEEE